MNYCPCCSTVLLQHIRTSGTYWFCRGCWQEMPVFLGKSSNSLSEAILDKMPKNSSKKNIVKILIT